MFAPFFSCMMRFSTAGIESSSRSPSLSTSSFLPALNKSLRGWIREDEPEKILKILPGQLPASTVNELIGFSLKHDSLNVVKEILHNYPTKNITTKRYFLSTAISQDAINSFEYLATTFPDACPHQLDIPFSIYSPLQVAAMNPNGRKYLEIIDSMGVDVNLPPESIHDAPLSLSVQFGLIDNSSFLISKGADPNVPGKFGSTPLFSAVKNSDLEMVNLLLDSGADPLYLDDNCETPFHSAILSSPKIFNRLYKAESRGISFPTNNQPLVKFFGNPNNRKFWSKNTIENFNKIISLHSREFIVPPHPETDLTLATLIQRLTQNAIQEPLEHFMQFPLHPSLVVPLQTPSPKLVWLMNKDSEPSNDQALTTSSKINPIVDFASFQSHLLESIEKKSSYLVSDIHYLILNGDNPLQIRTMLEDLNYIKSNFFFKKQIYHQDSSHTMLYHDFKRLNREKKIRSNRFPLAMKFLPKDYSGTVPRFRIFNAPMDSFKRSIVNAQSQKTIFNGKNDKSPSSKVWPTKANDNINLFASDLLTMALGHKRVKILHLLLSSHISIPQNHSKICKNILYLGDSTLSIQIAKKFNIHLDEHHFKSIFMQDSVENLSFLFAHPDILPKQLHSLLHHALFYKARKCFDFLINSGVNPFLYYKHNQEKRYITPDDFQTTPNPMSNNQEFFITMIDTLISKSDHSGIIRAYTTYGKKFNYPKAVAKKLIRSASSFSQILQHADLMIFSVLKVVEMARNLILDALLDSNSSTSQDNDEKSQNPFSEQLLLDSFSKNRLQTYDFDFEQLYIDTCSIITPPQLDWTNPPKQHYFSHMKPEDFSNRYIALVFSQIVRTYDPGFRSLSVPFIEQTPVGDNAHFAAWAEACDILNCHPSTILSSVGLYRAAEIFYKVPLHLSWYSHVDFMDHPFNFAVLSGNGQHISNMIQIAKARDSTIHQLPNPFIFALAGKRYSFLEPLLDYNEKWGNEYVYFGHTLSGIMEILGFFNLNLSQVPTEVYDLVHKLKKYDSAIYFLHKSISSDFLHPLQDINTDLETDQPQSGSESLNILTFDVDDFFNEPHNPLDKVLENFRPKIPKNGIPEGYIESDYEQH